MKISEETAKPHEFSPKALVALLTSARKRRGWTLLRLSVEAGVPYETVKNGMGRQRIGLTTALKLAMALQFTIAPPPPQTPINASQAQFGR
jgi:lambda repressor-like predicted transcriptional regulator